MDGARRIFRLWVPYLLLWVWGFPTARSQETAVLTVAHDGSGTHSSIQKAIDAADPGATVRIGSGLYAGNLVITKPLMLEGAGWDKSRIAPGVVWSGSPEGAAQEYRAKLNVREPPPPLDEDGEFAWERTDTYVPPSFHRFFPDDPAGGEKLDRLYGDLASDKRPDREILDIVRAGLRRTRNHRTSILRTIGNRYIWGKRPQNPYAVEVMYHAADPTDGFGTRHYAV
ncbi:MAG: hypothetical protein HQ559_03545, partial [Lentisphaerae bacterium]|nr:hypothetical protein [Lentisphaerota bacterium]